MTRPIQLVALDMAGTTVADQGAVEEAFQVALDAVDLTAGALREDPAAYVRRTMGQSKITVFTELLGGDRHRAEQANTAFELAFDQAVDRGEVGPMPGAGAAFAALRGAGMRICLTTGFSPPPGTASSPRSAGRAPSTSPCRQPTPDGADPGPT